MRLDGKVALVTGASAGIGTAVAEQLAAAGVQVIIHGRDEERTEAVAKRIGGVPLLGDLAVPGAAATLADAALDVHGRIDIVVANAGLGWSGPFAEMTAAEIDRLVAVDLLAPVQLVRRLLPPMLERGAGHVALVGSVAGRTGVAGEAVYAATKAALDVFAESLRLEVRGTGVAVSLTIPGVVDTGFFAARGRPYDRGRPSPVPASDVARALVDAITRDRAEVWVPGWLRVAPVVRALTPGLYRRLAARFGEQVMSRPEKAWLRDMPDTVLPSSDAFFLHIESTGAAQHVGGLVMLEPTNDRPSIDDVRALVRDTFAQLPRMHQRLAPTSRWRRPRWIEAESVDLDWHVTEFHSADGKAGLLRILGELAETPMPRDRPMWRVAIVRDVGPGGADALVVLVHHSIADGIGTVLQALSLFEPRATLPVPAGRAPGRVRRAAAVAVGLAQLATDGTAASLPPSSPRRGFGVADVELEVVRRTAAAQGVRVTDVVIALLADAVYAVAPDLAASVGGRMHFSVTTMVRTPDSAAEGNATAAVIVDVPVDGRPFDDLLVEVAARTRRLRRPTRAMASRFVMATGLRLVPEPFARWFARTVYGPRFLHAVVSNMPGPTVPLTFAGVGTGPTYPILPLVPETPLAVGALSWNGVLGIGLATDPQLLDAAAVAQRLDATLARLRKSSPVSVSGSRPLEGEEESSA